MQTIPLPKVHFQNQTRTFAKGLSSAVMANARHGCSQSVSINAKSASSLSESALDDAAQAVLSLADCKRAKSDIEVELKSVIDAIAVLQGFGVDSTQHPLVKHCAELFDDAVMLRRTHDDLSAAGLGDTLEQLIDLREALANEAGTCSNRYEKATTAAKKAFGAALARCADADDVMQLLDDNNTTPYTF